MARPNQTRTVTASVRPGPSRPARDRRSAAWIHGSVDHDSPGFKFANQLELEDSELGPRASELSLVASRNFVMGLPFRRPTGWPGPSDRNS